jgi:hypothetical protein
VTAAGHRRLDEPHRFRDGSIESDATNVPVGTPA